MQLSMLNIKILLKNTNVLYNHQIVRWSRPRKPFWLGIAKSKMFIVKEPKIFPELENIELQRLQNNYNLYYKSFLNFVKYENPIFEHDKSKFDGSGLLQNPDENALAKNEAWNAKSAELRRKRLKLSEENLQTKILLKISDAINFEEQKLKKIEEIVINEKVKSKSYITLENLNEAVEECLNKEKDYNFAIDLGGNKYYGQNVKALSQNEMNKNT